MKQGLIEIEHGCDHKMEVVSSEKYVGFCVTEEHAMDSYNQKFTCSIYLDRKEATKVRDFLNECLV